MFVLTGAEKLFCQIFAETHDLRAAFSRSCLTAGAECDCETAALALLERADIRREVTRWEKLRRAREAEIVAGFRRLAFGSVTDAVRLLLAQEVPATEELERMDLFNVSEIKRPKGGGLEIKFFDRLKALELLAAHSAEEDGALGGFLKALKGNQTYCQKDDRQ
ncbi:MAG: terminase small subunit [Oscillospiraceae bacterium]|jgi:hypothetical protein|nr:terminase small subunit [Oscillospiraceae bacterium]